MREGTPFVVRGCGRSKMMSWAPEVMDRVAREAEPLPGIQARQTLQACASMLQHGVHDSLLFPATRMYCSRSHGSPCKEVLATWMVQQLHI